MLSLAGCAKTLSHVKAKKTNIVLIMADDLGPEVLGCYGAKDVKTPNIDKLAEQGTFFKTAWTVPVCSPSRVLLLTGRYGFRTGEWNMGDRVGGPAWAKPPLNFCKYQPTFPKMLQKAGYRTAIAGKWQLVSPDEKAIPMLGFDEYCMWSIPFKEGFGSKEIINAVGKRGNHGSRYWHPSVIQNGERIRIKEADYGPDIYTSFLIDFMKRNKEHPVLLYYPMALPHGPLNGTPDHDFKVDGEDPKHIRLATEYIDKLVGRIVKAFEEEGLTDDTIFIFCGDNGTELNGKNTPTDKGCHVPLIVKGPGVKKQGIVDSLVDFSDIMPTIAAFANTELIPGFEYDGHDLSPILRGEKTDVREWVFSYMGPYKMVRNKHWILECESEDHPGSFYYAPERGEDIEKNTPELEAMRRKLQAVADAYPAPVCTKAEREYFSNYLTKYHSGKNLLAIPDKSKEIIENNAGKAVFRKETE